MTIWHLRDMAFGERHMIMQKDVKLISVPYYKNIKIKQMLEFARDYPEVMEALPIEAEIDLLNRKYLANVIHTIIGEPF